ncbi:mitochondrial Rho GTPase 1-like protein, partial [Tanacetum coccineum]
LVMEGVDRLNELKDEMLVNNIMSRLDYTTKELIRTTTTISKRWKNLWTQLPHLIFSAEDDITDFGCHDTDLYVDLWLRDVGVGQKFTYDDELFFNNLCFNRVKVSYCEFNPPNSAISWGRLECLCLSYVTLYEDMIEKILSGSPCLESLELKNCPSYRRIDVTSRSVKKLVFSDYYFRIDGDYIDCIKINAPYISSLTIKGEFEVKLVLLDVSSLIKAELDYSIDPGMSDDITHEEMLRGLLESLDHVKDVIINDFWWEIYSHLKACGDKRLLMLTKKLLTLHRASPLYSLAIVTDKQVSKFSFLLLGIDCKPDQQYTLTRTVSAIKARDGALSDAELNDFQESMNMASRFPECGAEIKRTPHQSVELTSEVLDFLRGVFITFDVDGDGALNEQELEDVFSTAPESPWSEAPYANAAETDILGGLSFDGFLSQWALMTLLNPILSVQNLVYIGYAGDPSSAVRVTRKRRVDRKKQHSDRNVFQCFVFGPKEAGKSSLLDSFVGRPFSQVYTPTTEERYTVNMVDQPGGTKKTLILREIPEDAIEKLLVNKEALGACDVAVFVHDSSKEASWIRAKELLVQVASHGEFNGYEVPCLIVAAKDDLEPYPNAIEASTGVSQDMGIQAPIPICTKLGGFNNVFKRTVAAAEHPHLSIPETQAGKTRKWYHSIRRDPVFFSFIAFVYLGFYLLIKVFWNMFTV